MLKCPKCPHHHHPHRKYTPEAAEESSAIAPSILHSLGILLFPDPSVQHYFVCLHAPVYRVWACWANTPQNTPEYISVSMPAGSASKSVDTNMWLQHPAEIFQQGLSFQWTNTSREFNFKHNDATISSESFLPPLDAALSL